jgi:peptidoglycan/LPS O-acetylase OafA/YrhL
MSRVENTERLHGLDALRGFALLLGVVLHGAMSFMSGPAYWFVTDTDRSAVLNVTFYVIHMFRMATFFLIAGFFAHMLFHRVGAKAFVKDRLRRIGVPLIVGWPILLGGIAVTVLWAAVETNNLGLPAPAIELPKPRFTLTSFPLTHLWFLYLLLVFYGLTLLVRGTVVAIDGKGVLRSLADRVMTHLAGPFGPAILATPLAFSLNFRPQWVLWFGIPTPDNSLIPNVAAFIGYGTAIGFGWMLHRQIPLLRTIQKWWAWHLLAALGATVACLLIIGVEQVLLPAAQDSRKLLYAILYSIGIWSWAFALIGIALRFFAGFSAPRRYIADASYWIYLVHLPLVLVLQVVMAKMKWPTLIEFPLLLAIAFGVMLTTYQIFVRYSFIGATLNGRRKDQAANS